MKYDTHDPTREFLELNLEQNLIPTITKPTRITKTSATLLDNIIVGKYFHNFTANIAICDISDHLPIVMNSHQPSLYKKKPLTMTTRVLNEEACRSITDILQRVNWTENLESKTAEESYSCFHKEVQSTLDKISPLKQIRIRPSKIIKDPWMTPGLQRCSQKQRLLYKKHLGNPNDQEKLNKYRTYRNKLKQILRKTKENYYLTKCKEYKGNLSKLWKVINKITHKMNDKSSVIEYLRIDNIDYYETKIITEEFAKYFATVGNRYASKIPTPQLSFHHYLKQIPQNQKRNEMKNADVIPLYKSKEKFLVNNYRPISLLVTISKLLEKVVYTRTYKFLCDTNQLYQRQYGFRSGYSCENAICELVGTIAKHKEQKETSIGVFIDLSKAFDTLNHSMLLSKMEKYSIRGLTLEWYRSYLSNRSMRVKCTSNTTGQLTYSTYQKLDYSTPQGSCLGPLLFLIYINDLYQSIEYCNMILFADDTTLVHGHKSVKYLKWMIEEDLKRMTDWFNANLLTINLDKTECILFPLNNTISKTEVVTMMINDKQLKGTLCTKFLGTWIDNKLYWKTHTNNLLMKIKQNTNLLRVGNKFLNKASKKIYYYAHIFSHISYGLVVWGNMIDNTTKGKMQICMDICFNLITHQAPNITNYKREKMLRLDELITLENVKLGYKMEHSQLPLTIQNLMKTDSKKKSLVKTHSYQTRTKSVPKLPTAQNKSYHASFLVQTIKEYSNLSIELRESNTLSSFIKKIKRKLLEN